MKQQLQQVFTFNCAHCHEPKLVKRKDYLVAKKWGKKEFYHAECMRKIQNRYNRPSGSGKRER